MRLGIDVGGTNTDAVLLTDEGRLLAVAKQPTSSDILSGIREAVRNVLLEADVRQSRLEGIFIGTTHVLNAIHSRRELARTALIRISRQAAPLEPAIGWLSPLKPFIHSHHFIKSGNGYHGMKSGELELQLPQFMEAVHAGEIESVCIVGAYSPMYEQEELCIKHLLNARFPHLPVTVSHRLGSIGFIERENAALLNAILSKVIRKALEGLSAIFKELSIYCPYWLIQNNGSLMPIEEAIEYPVLTIGSGIANSMRGAAVLSGYRDCIAVDFGGSTIDVGLVKNGLPVETIRHSSLLGASLGIPMPSFISLPIGGGSVVKEGGADIRTGQTIAHDLEKHAVAWGGKTWTVTDSFLKLYPDAFLSGQDHFRHLGQLDEDACQRVIESVLTAVKDTIEQLTVHEEKLPIVLVGGGSPLLNDRLFGRYRKVINPAGYHICNAIGACFAHVSEQVDKVYWLREQTKEEVIEGAVAAAREAVIWKGAKPGSVRIAYVEEYPFDYLQGEVLRVRTKAIGELEMKS